MQNLKDLVLESPYIAYSYSYPHKTAYRKLKEEIPLANLWKKEQKDSLFLYLHIPFCEMRCGFCNLFTTTNPKNNFEENYLSTLTDQANQLALSIKPAKFVRLAIGGGTPTYLSTYGLEKVLNLATNVFEIDISKIPSSIETSPLTATKDKLELLKQRSISRISIGVQSFIEEEVQNVGRSQKTSTVLTALDRIRTIGFPVLNIDLIYGLPEQTLKSWAKSLKIALSFKPEELYLYPLYIRPLTGLGRQNKAWEDKRIQLYRAGKEILLTNGYKQVSMRMFQLENTNEQTSPNYCCQTDGMVGLGAGARSYTSTLHYSNEYAVGQSQVKEIINSYISKPKQDFAFADYGFELDLLEQKHRHVIQSLLQISGLNLLDYQKRFNNAVLSDLTQLNQLLDLELATLSESHLQLTEKGIEQSDLIGYWLYSDNVLKLMKEYELR